ncbi:unnamed protein product [Paramecium pentaurelia]|uniref:Uncharacterized protein n=1 Tax=Paramecium pentaurelia TaxID=43138 RepID=A0A8S1VHJ9_9CILI|nr:unnamed protein product [Paramecium pentaurelia]
MYYINKIKFNGRIIQMLNKLLMFKRVQLMVLQVVQFSIISQLNLKPCLQGIIQFYYQLIEHYMQQPLIGQKVLKAQDYFMNYLLILLFYKQIKK